MANIEPIELEEFLKKTIKEIESGVDISRRSIGQTGIEIEVTTINTKKVDGSVKVYVLGVGGEQKEESVARIKFNVNPDYQSARPNDILITKGDEDTNSVY